MKEQLNTRMEELYEAIGDTKRSIKEYENAGVVNIAKTQDLIELQIRYEELNYLYEWQRRQDLKEMGV
jgi:hypothetical protein